MVSSKHQHVDNEEAAQKSATTLPKSTNPFDSSSIQSSCRRCHESDEERQRTTPPSDAHGMNQTVSNTVETVETKATHSKTKNPFESSSSSRSSSHESSKYREERDKHVNAYDLSVAVDICSQQSRVQSHTKPECPKSTNPFDPPASVSDASGSATHQTLDQPKKQPSPTVDTSAQPAKSTVLAPNKAESQSDFS